MNEQTSNFSVLQLFGKNIKQVRLLKKLSQENLADAIQKSVNFISLVENGKTGLSIQTIVDICKVLDTDANSLFDGIIPAVSKTQDDFIQDSLNLFTDEDKTIVTDLITYIKNSKK